MGMRQQFRAFTNRVREHFRSRASIIEERDRLQRLYSAALELRTRKLEYTAETQSALVEMEIEPNIAFAILANSLGKFLDEHHNATNYVEQGLTIDMPWRGSGIRGDFGVIIVRKSGKSPHELRLEAEQREQSLRDACRDALSMLEGDDDATDVIRRAADRLRVVSALRETQSETVLNTPTTYPREIAESTGLHLNALRKKPKRKPLLHDGLTASDAVKLLDREIRSAMKRGYTLDEIVTELRSQGLELSKATIKRNLKPLRKRTKTPASKAPERVRIAPLASQDSP